MFPYIIQGDAITIVVDGVPHTINKTQIAHSRLKEAIKASDWGAVRSLINPEKVVLNYASGHVSIKDGVFYWKGTPMHNTLSTRMIEMLSEGFPIDPLVSFMHNLRDNPSKRAVDELYGFLEKGSLPITPDGHFLAYKKVRSDYMDCHSGTISNHVGAVVTMERNEVDDDKDRTCSKGLHFCSRDYLNHFGGDRIVVLKINPADVVSIPTDYNNTKGRCCRYQVIGEITENVETAFTKSVQTNAHSSLPVKTAEDYDPYYGLYSEDDEFDDDSHAEADFEAYEDKTPDYGPEVNETLPQEYDKHGRPLSMTPDAIRKRRARAKKKAANSIRDTKPKSGVAWPFPKE